VPIGDIDQAKERDLLLIAFVASRGICTVLT
jgi:hypothetical protein